MSRAVSWFRDVGAVIAGITTIQGKFWIPIINTTTGRWHVLDGVTPGGIPMARLDDIPGGVPTVYTTPVSGATVSASAGDEKHHLTPAGILATLTFVLPPSPGDDDEFVLSTSQQITAITVNPLGLTGMMPAGSGMKFRYSDSLAAWYRVA